MERALDDITSGNRPSDRAAQALSSPTTPAVRRPDTARSVGHCITDEQELFQRVDDLVEYYRAHGRPKERLGHMMERLGEERVIREILEASGQPNSADQ